HGPTKRTATLRFRTPGRGRTEGDSGALRICVCTERHAVSARQCTTAHRDDVWRRRPYHAATVSGERRVPHCRAVARAGCQRDTDRILCRDTFGSWKAARSPAWLVAGASVAGAAGVRGDCRRCAIDYARGG